MSRYPECESCPYFKFLRVLESKVCTLALFYKGGSEWHEKCPRDLKKAKDRLSESLKIWLDCKETFSLLPGTEKCLQCKLGQPSPIEGLTVCSFLSKFFEWCFWQAID